MRPPLIAPALALIGAVLLSIAPSARAYDYEGHRLVSLLALENLPPSFPAFARSPAARERIAYLSGEPDRWRNTDEWSLRHASYPDHYFDFEDLEPMGMQPEALPPFRYLFAARVMEERTSHPDRFPPIDPARNTDHTREWPGFLPWTVAELYARLESNFATLRAFTESGGTPDEIHQAEASVIETMGILAHFVADGSQPLHTTRHYNGWTGPNPEGFTTNRSFHGWIDGGFASKFGLPSPASLQSALPAPQPLWGRSSGTNSPVLARVVKYLESQHAEVLPLYRLEKNGGLGPVTNEVAAGRAFLEARYLAGARFLGALWVTAFTQAPQDIFLKSTLARRQAAESQPPTPPSATPASAVPIIFDTDMAEDVDDVGALALLHALADRGEARILAVMVCSRNESVGPCVDAINTWYGRPEVPIGYQRNLHRGYPKPDPSGTPSKYAGEVAAAFPHALQRSSDAPEAALLYRKVLAAQPDHSVTVVSVGFLNNLRDLLDSGPDEASVLNGVDLVRRKVRQWVCMGGKFPEGRFAEGNGEYNVMYDTAASVRAIHDWPTPVVFSGFEIGVEIKTGRGLRDLPEPNPVRLAYQHYTGLADRESWDQTAVLYAVRGAGEMWRLSEPGLCFMHQRVPHGHNEWIPTPSRSHRYLVRWQDPSKVARHIEDLMLAPPRAR